MELTTIPGGKTETNNDPRYGIIRGEAADILADILKDMAKKIKDNPNYAPDGYTELRYIEEQIIGRVSNKLISLAVGGLVNIGKRK